MIFATFLKVITYVSVIDVAYCSTSCRRENNVIFTCNHIPKDIPLGISEFCLEIETFHTLSLNSSTFAQQSWIGLKRLKITETHQTDIVLSDNCFNGLTFLKELHIHVSGPEIFDNTFFGLLQVEKLDLSGCEKLTIDRLKNSLRGIDILPRLKELILSSWNTYKGSFSLDDDFVKTLLPRNITFLNLSNSQLSLLDWNSIKNLKYLKSLNLSHTIISNWFDDKVTPNDMKRIKMLDASHATVPFKALPFIPGRTVVSNISYNLSMLRLDDYRKWFAIETLNLTGWVPHFSSIWLYNATVIFDENPLMFSKYIRIGQNNLKRLDVRFVCDKFYLTSFNFMDISDNGLEFLHSSLLFCIRNIIHLDMSKNQLYKMVDENEIMFQDLISALQYLKVIRISENGLRNIPSNFFNGSRSMEEIDISYNKLKQIHFDLNHLEKLQVLNLLGNEIHVLDSSSIHVLNSISIDRNINASQTKVLLQSNPISCSVCSAKPFLHWILTTNHKYEKLKCTGENGKRYDIDRSTPIKVENICKRKVIIISLCISSAIIVVLVFVLVLIIYKRHKNQLKKRKTVQVINNLRQGEGQFKFAVFLSYSSGDEDFVKANIQDQLNENLQLMTGIDRQLVSTGDTHFRPGFYLHDEIDKMIEAASVVIVVVSNNFINSNYSCNEVNQAYKHGKPIMLMFMEHVEEREMERIPVMKTLFKRNVRILWTVENGEHVLKTTWENVGRSILELIEFKTQ